MAQAGLSAFGDPVQPVRQEPFHDERHGHGERKRALGYDSRRYLGHAAGQGRQAAGRTRSRTR